MLHPVGVEHGRLQKNQRREQESSGQRRCTKLQALPSGEHDERCEENRQRGRRGDDDAAKVLGQLAGRPWKPKQRRHDREPARRRVGRGKCLADALHEPEGHHRQNESKRRRKAAVLQGEPRGNARCHSKTRLTAEDGDHAADRCEPGPLLDEAE